MLDANDLPDGQLLTAQVCIVGAGAAGIALALEFIGTNIQVLVLEAGGFDPAAGADAAVEPQSAAGMLRRARRPDGATSAARATGSRRGVRCRRLTASELAPREHIPESGWPITAEALDDAYARALGLCESGASSFSARHDAVTLSQPLIAGLAGSPFSADRLDHYAPPEPLAQRHRRRLAAASNICVIGNARVTALHADSNGGSIDRLTVLTPAQRRLTVRARTVVLAAGSQETARLLLASRSVHRSGIGNAFGNVGRYCMSPLRGTIGIVRLRQPPVAIWHGPRNRLRSRRPLLLDAPAQGQYRLPAFEMRLRPIPADDLITATLARFGRDAAFGWRFRVNWHSEHYPTSDCRVQLDDTLDRDGVQQAVLDWHTGEAETRAARRALSLFDEALRKAGVGRFDHDPGALAALMNAGNVPAGSIVGGARMGHDPRSSVTDADGRVHSIDNLYVTGTAVFPTSGLDNPMLTAVALSLRLADHLKQRALAGPATFCSLLQPGVITAQQRAARMLEIA